MICPSFLQNKANLRSFQLLRLISPLRENLLMLSDSTNSSFDFLRSLYGYEIQPTNDECNEKHFQGLAAQLKRDKALAIQIKFTKKPEAFEYVLRILRKKYIAHAVFLIKYELLTRIWHRYEAN